MSLPCRGRCLRAGITAASYDTATSHDDSAHALRGAAPGGAVEFTPVTSNDTVTARLSYDAAPPLSAAAATTSLRAMPSVDADGDRAQLRERPKVCGHFLPLWNGRGETHADWDKKMMQLMQSCGTADLKFAHWLEDEGTRKGDKLRMLEYQAGWQGDGAIQPQPGSSGVTREAVSRLPEWLHRDDYSVLDEDTPLISPRRDVLPEHLHRDSPASPGPPGWKPIAEQVAAILADEDQHDRYFESRKDCYNAWDQAATFLNGLEERFYQDQADVPQHERLNGCPRRLRRRLQELSSGSAMLGVQAPALQNEWDALEFPERRTMAESLAEFDKMLTGKQRALKVFGAKYAVPDRDMLRKVMALTPDVIKDMCLVHLSDVNTYAEAYSLLIKMAGFYDLKRKKTKAPLPAAVAAAPAHSSSQKEKPKQGRSKLTCFVKECGGEHSAHQCPKLKAWTTEQKKEFVAAELKKRGYTPKAKANAVTAAAAVEVEVEQIPPPTVPAQVASAPIPPFLFAYCAERARFEPAVAGGAEVFQFIDGDFFPYDT